MYFREGNGHSGMKQKHWYDYLWIWTIIYFVLGFFNILFAWLGMIDFLVPLIIALFGGGKAFCNLQDQGERAAVKRHTKTGTADRCACFVFPRGFNSFKHSSRVPVFRHL